ncbi:MAG: GerMN domain-containing protein [Candidatus Colwellbacteria bacterium]|nr:GerMN domain-containing protein [Candidatus Colwellbacteria bacterium]
MNKDLVKMLIVLALIIAGMALSIAFFNRPQGTKTEGEAASPENPSSSIPSLPLESGIFSKEGDIADIPPDGSLSVMTSEGELRVSIDKAEISDESGAIVDRSYLARGIKVSVKGKDGVAEKISVLSSPGIVILSPRKDSPVNLVFKIDGSSKVSDGDVYLKIKNRRTGSLYSDLSVKVSASGGRYGEFSFQTNLSSALDILDGDMLDAEIYHLAPDKKIIDQVSSSWLYGGGMAARIKVFFIKDGQCGKTSSVDRMIDASRSSARASIEEMIKGPTKEEYAAGYRTAIPSLAKVRSMEVKPDSLIVDFTGDILGRGQVCDLSAIRRQIMDSLSQFPGSKKITIQVDGKSDNAFNR